MSESSQGSFSTGTGASSAASDTSDARALNDLNERSGNDGSIEDLVDQNRSVQDAVFASLYTLTKNTSQAQSVRVTAVRIVLDFLQIFLTIFNTSMSWTIDRNNGGYKATYWILIRYAVLMNVPADSAYSTYVAVFYVLAAAILGIVFTTVWVTLLLRKDDNSGAWLKRLVSLLQFEAFIVFKICWVSILDYIAFMLDCNWDHFGTSQVVNHVYFTDQGCLAIPHMAHMAFAIVVMVLFLFVTLSMSITDCDMNPTSQNLLTSPLAVESFKILALKMVVVICNTCLDTFEAPQIIIVVLSVFFTVYHFWYYAIYYNDWINHITRGLWVGILYTALLLAALVFDDRKHDPTFAAAMTWNVLYGIFPVILAFTGMSYLLLRFHRKPLSQLQQGFVDPDIQDHLKDVYRFSSQQQVEFLCRVMRKWDLDGVPDPDSTAFGEFVLKCGMARFPGSPFMLILYANFLIEVRKDAQSARTQLQLAAKSNPDIAEKYFIYAGQQVARSLKTEGVALDLMGYVEFQRNYRGCVKAHKLALIAQRQLWHALLHDSVSFKDLQRSFDIMHMAEQQAVQVYRKVMERYPDNGKLVRIYGRFLEYVCNDPWTASKFYAEALKLGQNDSLMALHNNEGGAGSSVMGAIDEKVDAIIIINASGIIMTVNAAGCKMFGYGKGQLEGKNISCLMPQPFSQKHNSFLSRYVETGVPHIINSLRQVVGLTKDHAVFPVHLAVSKISGTRQDSIFMGVIRPVISADDKVVQVYTTLAGIVLCAEERFADVFGITSEEIIGRPISSLGVQKEDINNFMARAVGASQELITQASLHTAFAHKYLSAVDVDITLEAAGTDEHRILIFNIKCSLETVPMMLVNNRGHICYANAQLSAMLKYPRKTLTKMDLQAIIPAPYAQLHKGWMKDASSHCPSSSCRAGGVVHLLAANSSRIPVTLQMSAHDGAEGIPMHFIKVLKCSEQDLLDQRRMMLTINQHGNVVTVSASTPKSLFGFSPSDVIGTPLSGFVNVFDEWCKKGNKSTTLLSKLASREQDTGGVSWRVGVHAPSSSKGLTLMNEADKDQANESALLGVLRHKKQMHAAVMQLEILDQSTDDDSNDAAVAAADSGGVLKIHLWSAELLSSVVEVDKKLTLTTLDAMTALMFGLPTRMLLRKPLTSLISLPARCDTSDLLDAHHKGAIKSTVVWKVGHVRHTDASHVDKQPMKLQLQAVSKDGQNSQNLLVLLRLHTPGVGDLQALLASTAHDAAAAARHLSVKQLPAADHHAHTAYSDSDDSQSEDDSEDGAPLRTRQTSRLRTEAWLNESYEDQRVPFAKHKHCAADAHGSNLRKAPSHARNTSRNPLVSQDSAKMRSPGANGSKKTQPKAIESAKTEAADDPAEQKDTRSHDDDASDKGSVASGASAATSVVDHDVDMASSAAEADEAELVVDWRRAKRLKKLKRMMTCTAAQSATDRLRLHTWCLVGGILVIHIVCFIIAVMQISDKYENSQNIRSMALAADRSQRMISRTDLLQFCRIPAYAIVNETCSQHWLDQYSTVGGHPVFEFQGFHQGLYLGFDGLQPFKDARLLEYWTYHKLPQQLYLPKYTNSSAGVTEQLALSRLNPVINNTATLWQMGNELIYSIKEVATNKDMGLLLNTTYYWNFVNLNGRQGIFEGYAWSTDVLVDYCYYQLGALINVMVILLVIEAVLLQICCMAYQYILLVVANSQHMQRFSVFLALPSATIRAMAARQCMVDEDDKYELDNDDELEAVAEAADQATAADKAPKSVRMAVLGEDDAADNDKQPGSPIKSNAAKLLGQRLDSFGAGAALHANALHTRKVATVWVWWSNLLRFLQGPRKLKINGHKLVPNSIIVRKFMAPLVLWAVAVIIIYAISFERLRVLQGPLASLDVAAHVMYRTSRVLMLINSLFFTVNVEPAAAAAENAHWRALVAPEIEWLEQEYNTLLYGGVANVQAPVSFNTLAPASVFADARVNELFFKTTACLRIDQTQCWPPGHPYYQVTRQGLNAMVTRFLAEAKLVNSMTDELTFPAHPSFIFLSQVAAFDMYEGMRLATQLFVDYTNSKLDEVKQLHIILLLITLLVFGGYVLMLFRPYIARVARDCKHIAGMLSNLPAEVDVEGHIKTVVLNMVKTDTRSSMNKGSSSMTAEQPAAANHYSLTITVPSSKADIVE